MIMIKNLALAVMLMGTVCLASAASKFESAVFAGGCFWGVDAVFKHVKGVILVISGYAGGKLINPTYSEVSDGGSGHAESVMVTFDPKIVSYKTLLEVFFRVAHDPTQFNRQGPDVGTQYRSAIFYQNESQRQEVKKEITSLTKEHVFAKPIVTQVSALDHFYPAESYHQNYLARHLSQPYIVFNDLPKLVALKKQFPELYF